MQSTSAGHIRRKALQEQEPGEAVPLTGHLSIPLGSAPLVFAMASNDSKRPLRSRLWFDDPGNPKMTALYLERYLNYGLTRRELQSGRPVIGIAQTGSDLVPCNRHLLQLADRVRDGIRDAGGVPLEFPVHPLIDRDCILVMRNVGPIGYPGSAEVVNMQPPDRLIREGVRSLPTLGDGRQSGTSASPSILHASPEAAVGGGLALLRTGDRIRVDLGRKRVDLLAPVEEIERRRRDRQAPEPVDETPWQEIYRRLVGSLSEGACLELGLTYRDVVGKHEAPRHSH
jgi:dihydroxyacid dehydratase/phosphogluconate dehydratase